MDQFGPPLPQPDAVLRPVTAKRSKRGLLIGGLATLAVAGVAVGGFMVLNTSDDKVENADTVENAEQVELAVETPESGAEVAGFSFAAASANAQAAASMSYDISMRTPEGPLEMSAEFDRASGRAALKIDMSQFAEDTGIPLGEAMQVIVDQSGRNYIGAEFFGAIFGETDAEWIVTEADESLLGGDGALDQLFDLPLEITDVFGDIAPVDLGPESVDGEELRHFEVTIDAAAMANMDDELFGSNHAQIVDVWVSEDAQIRRLAFDEDAELSVEINIDVSTEAIDIALPDPSTTTTMEELFGGFADLAEDFAGFGTVPVDE